MVNFFLFGPFISYDISFFSQNVIREF